jgi:monoamine oxidase
MRSLYARLHRRYGSRVSGSERKLQASRHLDKLQQRFPIDDWLIASKARPRRSRPTLAVVGAGFAGLTTGFLLAHDFKVVVLEARRRVGGRVHSIWDGTGRVTEAGGELIGYAHAFWMRLADHFRLGLSVLTREDDYAAQNLELPMQIGGRLLSPARQEALYREMQHAFDRMCRQAGRLSDPYRAWREKDAEHRDKMSLSDWIHSLPCSRLTKTAMEMQFANDNGAPAARQSFLANLALVAGAASRDHPDGYFKFTENVRCEDGNQMLAQKLAQEIEAQDGKVELANPVKKIELHPDKAVVLSARGRAIAADYLVLAVPPSAWARIVMDPPIEQNYVMSMGTVVKYLIQSDDRFWVDERLAPSSGSDRIGVTWEATDNQMRGRNQNIHFNLFAGGDPARQALQIFERGDLAAVHAFYDRGLGRIYKNYKNSRAPDPRFVPWPLEPWTWGGYSCPAPGEVCRVAPFLNRPFCRRLFFAGEHVCMPFFGYMEGALQSGAMVAHKILRT